METILGLETISDSKEIIFSTFNNLLKRMLRKINVKSSDLEGLDLIFDEFKLLLSSELSVEECLSNLCDNIPSLNEEGIILINVIYAFASLMKGDHFCIKG